MPNKDKPGIAYKTPALLFKFALALLNLPLVGAPLKTFYCSLFQSKKLLRGLLIKLKLLSPDGAGVHFFVFNTEIKDPRVSLIVSVDDNIQSLKLHLEALKNSHSHSSKEFIFIDRGLNSIASAQLPRLWMEHGLNLKELRIIKATPKTSLIQAKNIGGLYAKGHYLIFLDIECCVDPNFLSPLIEIFERAPWTGLVGCLRIVDYAKEERASDWTHISSSAMAIRRELWNSLNGLDSGLGDKTWEDQDLCLRVKSLGYTIRVSSESKVIYRPSKTQTGAFQRLTSERYFHQRWLSQKQQQQILTPSNEDSAQPKPILTHPSQAVIYSAVAGAYDRLNSSPEILSDTDHVAFMDKESFALQPPPSPWRVKSIEHTQSDPNRMAKVYKILPHIFFPEKEYSLWIDGSVSLKIPFTMSRLIELYLSKTDLCIFRHSSRNCIYEEAKVCKVKKLDSTQLIEDQISRYKKQGYPKNAGLVEATIILRRHSPELIEFCQSWWEEISLGSRRDQLSFNYVARKLNFQYTFFPLNIHAPNGLFSKGLHLRSSPYPRQSLQQSLHHSEKSLELCQ